MRWFPWRLKGLRQKATVRDYSCDMCVNVFVDASAAIGVTQRKGRGGILHLDTHSLWILDAVRQRKIQLNNAKRHTELCIYDDAVPAVVDFGDDWRARVGRPPRRRFEGANGRKG